VKGDYIPLDVHGRDRDHVIAFARRSGRKAVIVAVGRWFGPFTGGGRLWPRTHAIEAEIDLANLKTKFQANSIRLSEHFKELPVVVITA
jgi:(1->4)-alpha-D-glucan 1-alpha-D-glucosylmutase